MDAACSSQFLSCSFNSASKPSQIDENDLQKHHKNTHICGSTFLGEMIRLGLERRPPSQCRAGLGPVRRNAGLRECRAGPGRPDVTNPSYSTTCRLSSERDWAQKLRVLHRLHPNLTKSEFSTRTRKKKNQTLKHTNKPTDLSHATNIAAAPLTHSLSFHSLIPPSLPSFSSLLY